MPALHPDDTPIGRTTAHQELPLAARKWGRIIDTSQLMAGDLILTQPVDVTKDWISARIQRAQGNLGASHGCWTHAAVYLGDGQHVCEANLKVPGYRDSVMLRSLQEYSDAAHVLRARRPKVQSERERMGIAVGAMRQIGNPYSLRQIYQFWRMARTGRFWATPNVTTPINTRALVCSTLYQDALTFARAGASIRFGTVCTPAHLSANTADFESHDPPLAWLELE